MTATCRACGDPIGDIEARRHRLAKAGEVPADGEGDYCGECADELFRGRISARPARLFSAGRGGPGEPSPSQEDAVRAMEG